MNFNVVSYLYLFKLLLLNQNNPTAVWLILFGMRNKKNMISEKIKNEVICFCKLTLHFESVFIFIFSILIIILILVKVVINLVLFFHLY